MHTDTHKHNTHTQDKHCLCGNTLWVYLPVCVLNMKQSEDREERRTKERRREEKTRQEKRRGEKRKEVKTREDEGRRE